MVRFFVAIAFVGIVNADVRDISIVRPGDDVYFVTEHRLRGSNHGHYRKIYRWNRENGITLTAQQGDGPGLHIASIRESWDGAVRAINAESPCRAGTICVNTIQEEVTIHRGDETRTFPGEAWISPDGSSALIQRHSGFGFVPNPDDRALKRLDLTVPDAQPKTVGELVSPEGRFYSSNGAAVVVQNGKVVLLNKNGSVQDFLGEIDRTARVVLSSSGELVLTSGMAQSEAPFSPVRLIRRTGEAEELAPSGRSVDLSDDDSRLLYLAPAEDQSQQVFSIDLPGRVQRQITTLEGGYREATISGDGMTAYAVTHDGLLHRIDLRDGFTEVIVGSMPIVDRGETPLGQTEPRPIQVGPGSTYRMRGAALAPSVRIAPYPAPTELDGIQVLVAGRPAAILWISPWEIGYQVPWDTPLSLDPDAGEPYVVFRTAASEWEDLVRARVSYQPQPAVVDPETGLGLVIHQNFDRFVSEPDPALPGEYVHAYVTGLGPVAPQVALGTPAPDGPPLSAISTPCEWKTRFDATGRPLNVPYAGLAPGLIGFYQVVIRVPQGWEERSLAAFCNDQWVASFPTQPQSQ